MTALDQATKVDLLPARMKPFADELLSSWMMRLAMAHGLKLQSFCAIVFGRHRSLWNRDPDKLADKAAIDLLTARTDLDGATVYATTLAAYAGKMYERHNPNGKTGWIMPIGVYHRRRLRPGLQFCPDCLHEDSEPYYRRLWRVSWATVCTKHRVTLLDRCPACRQPVNFHRNEMGIRNKHVADSMIECTSCHHSLADKEAATLVNSVLPSESLIKFQIALEQTLCDGWFNLNQDKMVYGIAFFKGLRQLLNILAKTGRRAKLRTALARARGLSIDDELQTARVKTEFDCLPLFERQKAVASAEWLLTDWPKRFVEVCAASHIWSSTLLQDCADAPFWYWREVHDHLMRHSYQTTKEEILAALDYLLCENKFVMPAHLKSVLGKTDLFRKSCGEIETIVYERMKRHNQKLFKAECSGKIRNKRVLQARRNKRKRFVKIQTGLNERIAPLKERERLRWIKRYEEIKNLELVGQEFNVSPGIVKKWHARYREKGLAGLVEHSRVQHRAPHRKIFDEQEQWILQLHEKGMNMSEICAEVERLHNFQITLWVVRKVLDKHKFKPAKGIGNSSHRHPRTKNCRPR